MDLKRSFFQNRSMKMQKTVNRNAVIFLALTAYLMIYRGLWKAGLPDFYAGVVGCLFVFFLVRLTGAELMIENTGKKMTLPVFLTLLGLTYLGQLLRNPINAGLELALNSFGLSLYTAPEAVQARQLFSDALAGLTTLLWPFVLGPILEELLYRSYAAKNFERDGGKILAILVSAFAFSIAHGRLQMCVNTFVAALVLGYILFEYGIKWAVIFHIINNLGIVGLDLLLSILFNERTGSLISDIIGVVLSLFAAVVICRHRREAAAYIRVNRAPAGQYRKAFFNAGFPVFLAYCIYKWGVNIAPM